MLNQNRQQDDGNKRAPTSLWPSAILHVSALSAERYCVRNAEVPAMGQPIAPAGAQLAVGTYVHVLSRSPKTVTQVPPLQTGITESTSIRGDGKLRSRRLLPSALQLEFPRAVSRCQKFGLARKGLRAGAARRWAASRVLPNVRSTSILSPPYNSNPQVRSRKSFFCSSVMRSGTL